MYFTKVIVQYSSGPKAKGIRVVLSISAKLSGGITQNVYTDRFGIAIISHESKGSAMVMVNGSTKIIMQVPGETVVFI